MANASLKSTETRDELSTTLKMTVSIWKKKDDRNRREERKRKQRIKTGIKKFGRKYASKERKKERKKNGLKERKKHCNSASEVKLTNK